MAPSTFIQWFGKKGFSLRRIRELFMTKKDVEAAASVPVKVAINLCPTAPVALLSGLHSAFLSQTKSGLLHVADVVPGKRLRINPSADIAIVLAPADERLMPCAAQTTIAWARSGVPVVVLGSSQNVLVQIETETSLAFAKRGSFVESDTFVVKTICATTAKDALGQLSAWMINTSEKTLALGANWTFLREGACRKVIMDAALANVAVGGIDLIPGADFPLMAINQVQMAMKIATMYGYKISAERIPELLFIMLSGLMLRGIAKGLTAPLRHGKFLIKGALGFAGTWLVGEALVQRFENGQTIDEVLDDMGATSKAAIEKVSDTLSTKLGELTGGLLEIEPGAIYRAH